jgi:hypothetical protein
MREFSSRLRRAQPKSIDFFLGVNPQFRDIGKLAIAASLIQRDQAEHLQPEPKDDWYRYFFSEILGHGNKLEDTLRNTFSIVTFNFDRSFEFAFSDWIEAVYGLTKREAYEAAGTVPVVHVNGRLGGIPWVSGESDARDYEPDVAPEELMAIASRLRLVGDQDPDPSVAERVRALLDSAERVFFLGFGYHDANLAWLARQGLHLVSRRNSSAIFGSFLGCPAGRIAVVNDGYFVQNAGASCFDVLNNSRDFWD